MVRQGMGASSLRRGRMRLPQVAWCVTPTDGLGRIAALRRRHLL